METRCYFLLLCFMPYFFIATLIAIETKSIATDESALLALKSHIISDPHQFLSMNWSANTPTSSVCDWRGVKCGMRHQRVTALSISNMALSGTIPPELGNLSFLESLDIGSNYFHGNLPGELSRLRRLKFISLGYNNFTGEIPMWFGRFPQLQTFVMRNNNFTGLIPASIFNLSKLEHLNFEKNSLRGKIPEQIGNLQRLKFLNLQRNQLVGSISLGIFNISTLEIIGLTFNNLSGTLPVDICSHLSNLKGFFLSFNQIHGEIPSGLVQCSQLQELSLAYNKFSGSIPKEIGNLEMLQTLYLGDNYLQGVIPIGIFNLSRLIELSLGRNQLTGNLPWNIALPNLEILQLHENNIGGTIPASIGNCSKLTSLSLDFNQFMGSIPNSIGNLELLEELRLFKNNLTSDPATSELEFLTSLTNCKNLRALQLSDNPFNGVLPTSIGNLSTSLQYFLASASNIKGQIPREIGYLSSLITLSLQFNQLTGVIPPTIQNLQNLQGLALDGTKLGGNLEIFCKMHSLSELYLSNCQISGRIPDCFGNMTSLRRLSLQYNLLTSSVPRSLWGLRDLLNLYLGSNSFMGTLPPEIGNLKSAISIDMSMNQFSGDIPPTMENLQNLQNLTLAGNRLQGSIPESFGNMFSLTYLDLSNNSLSGLIPKSLEKVQSLKVFNVSFNHLTGAIPSGGPFGNFSSESFISNDALCGDSRFDVPPCKTNPQHRSKLKRVLLIMLISLGIAIVVVLALAVAFIRYQRKKKVPTPNDETRTGRVSYYELLQATDRFSESNLLGSGSFGSVYKAILNDGKSVAVKVFDLQLEGADKSFDVECEALRNLRHRNLVKVISSCTNLDFKALVLEYMCNGSLEKWLHSPDHFLNGLQRLDIMIDVASALQYLHHESFAPVIHCDLKPSNVLIDENMVGHVSDFGITKLLGKEESTVFTKTLATIGYMGPEYGLEGLVSTACDVYSFGILLMEVFTRKRPSDEMFDGNLNFRSWIQDSVPNATAQLVDARLLNPDEEHYDAEILECFSSIMILALNCVPESPKERMNMKVVVDTLQKIKLRYIQSNRCK